MHMLWFAANVICVSCFPFHLQVELKSAIPLDEMRAVAPPAAVPYPSAYTAGGGGMGVGGAEPPQEQICKLFIGGLTLTTTKCKMI